MISFIIPAYNEEALIGATIESLHVAAQSHGEPFEIIVVDDASTDRTAEIAHRLGARVVHVQRRHIAAVRNAGAKQAQGDVLVFVDADTIVPPRTLQAAMHALQDGAVGGGAAVEMEGNLPIIASLYFTLFMLVWRPMKLAAGCFVYARREAFEAIGGFDERYFASEEMWLSWALKKQGRFVVVPETVVTSARKVRMYSPLQLFSIAMRLLIGGPKAWQKREGLEMWYDGRRETPPPSPLRK